MEYDTKLYIKRFSKIFCLAFYDANAEWTKFEFDNTKISQKSVSVSVVMEEKEEWNREQDRERGRNTLTENEYALQCDMIQWV